MKTFSIYALACLSAASRLQVQAYSAYNAHSIYGYQWGTDDSSFVDTSDWDGGNNLSWQSVVECFPDKRYDWSASSPYDTDAKNYDNWACNLAFDNNWKDGSMFPCGADESTPVWYFLNDVAGTPLGPDNTGKIGCYLSEESYGQQRNIQFPEGYFIVRYFEAVPSIASSNRIIVLLSAILLTSSQTLVSHFAIIRAAKRTGVDASIDSHYGTRRSQRQSIRRNLFYRNGGWRQRWIRCLW